MTRVLGDNAMTGAIGDSAMTGVIGDGTKTRAAGDNRDTALPGGVVLHAGESGPLESGQSFGPRYHIIRLLGAGGMGAVYQAWDAELGVAVAIKVIRPEAMADATIAADIERRFKRELLLARQVTHKNVVRIHDIGQIDGVKYITMSYVDGVDLATTVKREGRLPVDRVLQIARSVVSGLAAAHAAGVVHRDLKPANIMLQADGHALIMDFGIARSTGDPARDTAAGAPISPGHLARDARIHTTMAGVIVGTVEYMAPEQAKGEPVDQRADVYAFGLILYDLLTGKSRDHPEGPVAELQARMRQAPPPLKTIAQDVPDALARTVMRCIDPNPAARYQSAAEIVAELDRLDARGALIPVKRTVRLPLVVALAIFLLMFSGLTWFLSRNAGPPVPHDPVSVVIADFQNTTGEPTFDLALEQTVRRGLEDAGFISAFDRSRIRTTLGEAPPDKLDETAARALAVKAGLGVVLAGSIGPRGNGFDILIKATRAITGNEIVEARGRASSKDDVVSEATQLVARVRRALGDELSDSEQLLAMRSVSTTSLEVVSHYARAMDSQSRGQYEEARQAFLKALELDPEFGLGYQALAVISRNLGRLQEANTYINEALRHLTGMTERERFATRGFQFRLTGDYKQCANEFGQMTARFAADAIAFNQRALCSSKLRDLRQAVEEMRRALQILPNHTVFRGNLAVYTAYAGDFATAEQEARSVQQPSDLATLAIAFSQIGQGQRPAAVETYQGLSRLSPRGASWAASGGADLALFEGRFSDEAGLFETGAAADLAAKSSDRAARKLTSLAYARLQQGRPAAAVQAAERALANSNAAEVRFLAARALVEGGVVDRARTVADALAAELPAEPQAYGKILQGQIALKNGDPRAAIKILSEANEVLNTWLGHFELGRAYLEAGALTQADSEFDRCIERRGEALSLLVDEEPTYGYLPIVYYYQGRVREGLQNARFADSYREYLAIRGASSDDPLLPELRKRADSR